MGNQEDKYRDYQLKWFDIVMQEYNSLRAESGDSLKNQQSIINYGLTAIGVLIAFSANLWGKEQIVESIYVFIHPFLVQSDYSYLERRSSPYVSCWAIYKKIGR